MTENLVVGVMPKEVRNPYFERCAEGAREAAAERGATLRWEGPEAPDAAAQAGQVTRWVADGLPVIAVSVEDRAGLSPVLREARRRGVRVLTWDADADPEARDFTVAPASVDGIARALALEVGRALGGRGEVGIITSTLAAPNQSAWLDHLRTRLASEFPGVRVVGVLTCDDIEERALRAAEGLLTAHPGLGALVGLCTPAVPGAARAVRRAGRDEVHVTGLSVPGPCEQDLREGWVDSLVTWSARDLGYLAVWAAAAVAEGALEAGSLRLEAGRLGSVRVEGDEVRLGDPYIVTARNLEQFLD